MERLAIEPFSSPHEYPKPLVSVIINRSLQIRMDSFYFSAPNQDAHAAYNNFPDKTRELREVADVFIPGIFKRKYADDPQFGIPYLTGADIFQLSPSSERFLIRKVVDEQQLLLKKGMIVVQEAGQLGGLIGRSMFVGGHLDGFSCSNNMVRITAADPQDTGYLFVALSNELGVRLLAREAAGSSIPHMEVSRVRNIRLPWPDEEIRLEIGDLAIKARELRDAACVKEEDARRLIENAIGAFSNG